MMPPGWGKRIINIGGGGVVGSVSVFGGRQNESVSPPDETLSLPLLDDDER